MSRKSQARSPRNVPTPDDGWASVTIWSRSGGFRAGFFGPIVTPVVGMTYVYLFLDFNSFIKNQNNNALFK